LSHALSNIGASHQLLLLGDEGHRQWTKLHPLTPSILDPAAQRRLHTVYTLEQIVQKKLGESVLPETGEVFIFYSYICYRVTLRYTVYDMHGRTVYAKNYGNNFTYFLELFSRVCAPLHSLAGFGAKGRNGKKGGRGERGGEVDRGKGGERGRGRWMGGRERKGGREMG